MPTLAPQISVPPELQGELVYIAFPLQIRIDGSLEDSEAIPSIYMDRGPYLVENPQDDGSFRFAVSANEENLYILMLAADKNIIAGMHGSDFWNEDSMEFYINASPDLNARSYAPQMF